MLHYENWKHEDLSSNSSTKKPKQNPSHLALKMAEDGLNCLLCFFPQAGMSRVMKNGKVYSGHFIKCKK
jgi:hypothetical protein